MSENNENNEDSASKTSNLNDETDNNEYPPNVVRLDPDIGLGNQQNSRKRRSSGSHARREESSISFRHFLQNEVGHFSNNSDPDLYSCSRKDRSLVDGSVVDPDSPDLPDFVQDHLAVEHMYFNDGDCALPVNMQNLPDFASCMPSIENDEMADIPQNHDNRRAPRNRVPLDLPVPNFLLDNEIQTGVNPSLPFDLTTQASVASNACETRSLADIELAGSGGGRLPDFLSDGHVLAPNNPRNRDVRVPTTENVSGSEAHVERHNLISMLRHENYRLRDELSVLQSVLMKKDDRIKELEDIVMALEISKLQMSADANTQTSKCGGQRSQSRNLSVAKPST